MPDLSCHFDFDVDGGLVCQSVGRERHVPSRIFKGKEHIHMKTPEGFEQRCSANMVLLSLKTVHRLKQAAVAFWRQLLIAFKSSLWCMKEARLIHAHATIGLTWVWFFGHHGSATVLWWATKKLS
jgi:hypothetical protein